jgi:hypothetical protein
MHQFGFFSNMDVTVISPKLALKTPRDLPIPCNFHKTIFGFCSQLGFLKTHLAVFLYLLPMACKPRCKMPIPTNFLLKIWVCQLSKSLIFLESMHPNQNLFLWEVDNIIIQKPFWPFFIWRCAHMSKIDFTLKQVPN